ncbi:MAG: 4'-phosphopantetheinyl transferase superfamily protein [Myxococcota bacterium]|nr:4'-phosphopantetheinyl transferase superfamily protein [Myxococcota bacterium]
MIEEALRALLGSRVRFAVRVPGQVPLSALRPEEEALAARAVDKRRLELAAGRDAARDALRQLGAPAASIGRGDRGEPLWPEGVVGTITHTDTLCVAAVADARELDGLGLDAEPDAALEEELWGLITTREEHASLRDDPRPGERARRTFCAKEAAYKCQYPLSGTFLEFEDVVIRHGEGDRFEAVFQRRAAPFQAGFTISGRFVRAADHVIAAAWIPGGEDLA